MIKEWNYYEKEDEVTRRVSQAGALLGIPLQDHIIIGGGANAEPPYSFREHFPEFFSGVYDPDYIHGLLEGRSPEAGEGLLSGKTGNGSFFAGGDTDDEPMLAHGRSR